MSSAVLTNSFSAASQEKMRSMTGMALWIAGELMFFAGLLSAYWVLRSQILLWPPLDQPSYPVVWTAFNSAILLMSGGVLYFSKLSYLKRLGWAFAGGSFFVLFQAYEWWSLIRFGMGMKENVYGGVFYMTVGAHALHALLGLALMLWAFSAVPCASRLEHRFYLARLYWIFVVLLWPVIYGALYVL